MLTLSDFLALVELTLPSKKIGAIGPIPPILITKLCCFLWHVVRVLAGASSHSWP